jgi:hypothetical protein
MCIQSPRSSLVSRGLTHRTMSTTSNPLQSTRAGNFGAQHSGTKQGHPVACSTVLDELTRARDTELIFMQPMGCSHFWAASENGVNEQNMLSAA